MQPSCTMISKFSWTSLNYISINVSKWDDCAYSTVGIRTGSRRNKTETIQDEPQSSERQKMRAALQQERRKGCHRCRCCSAVQRLISEAGGSSGRQNPPDVVPTPNVWCVTVEAPPQLLCVVEPLMRRTKCFFLKLFLSRCAAHPPSPRLVLSAAPLSLLTMLVFVCFLNVFCIDFIELRFEELPCRQFVCWLYHWELWVHCSTLIGLFLPFLLWRTIRVTSLPLSHSFTLSLSLTLSPHFRLRSRHSSAPVSSPSCLHVCFFFFFFLIYLSRLRLPSLSPLVQSDLSVGEWQPDGNSGTTSRVLSYTIALNNPLGPKTAPVVETQVSLRCRAASDDALGVTALHIILPLGRLQKNKNLIWIGRITATTGVYY